MSRCHAAVCGPGRWCAATAWPAALRCPRPPALDTRPASTSTSLAAPARFLQIFIQTCVCLHTDNTQLCLRVWSVWCLYGELPLPPLPLFVISVNISVDTAQWAAVGSSTQETRNYSLWYLSISSAAPCPDLDGDMQQQTAGQLCQVITRPYGCERDFAKSQNARRRHLLGPSSY